MKSAYHVLISFPKKGKAILLFNTFLNKIQTYKDRDIAETNRIKNYLIP